MVFIKFLFIFLAIIWFIGLILRATFNRFLRKNVEAYNRAAKEAQKQAQRQARKQREGSVTVEAPRAAVEKKVSRGVGEYVEFEEVEVVEDDDSKNRK
ncbi:MAG: DUF4834 family protein [Alistipes sp.]|jgi:Na+-transporting methylmalonyl-CoA/oxaloacetate decarboxylase gamma subunit|nr:DUF4834 family protein [Alistipes sp.]